MEGIMRFLTFIIQNWTALVAIAALLFAIYMKAKTEITRWLKLSDEEKQKELDKQIASAKKAIANYILSYVATAEIDWEGTGLGPIKRAQVIEKIYKDYPILLDVCEQEALISFIDDLIDEALEVVREKLRKEAANEL